MLSRFRKKQKVVPTVDLRVIENNRLEEAARRRERDEKLIENYEHKKKILKSAARRTGVLGRHMAKDVGHAAKVAWVGLGQIADNLEAADRREAARMRQQAPVRPKVKKHKKAVKKAIIKRTAVKRTKARAQKPVAASVLYVDGREYTLRAPKRKVKVTRFYS